MPAGPTSPVKLSISKSRSPASAKVGVSGSAAWRALEATAMARIFPPRTLPPEAMLSRPGFSFAIFKSSSRFLAGSASLTTRTNGVIARFVIGAMPFSGS